MLIFIDIIYIYLPDKYARFSNMYTLKIDGVAA